MEQVNKIVLEGVTQTLFIPLVARAQESHHPNPIIQDEKAVQLLKEIDTANYIVDGGNISTLGILARTHIIDEQVRKIVSQSASTVIINLGVGLDTRCYRISEERIRWYDIDFPEVIKTRKTLMADQEQITFIGQSVLEDTWMNKVVVNKADSVIIIAEGLFMYFTKVQVKQILGMLAEKFPNAHLFLDVVHSFFINKKISSSFLWGIDMAQEIEGLDCRVKLVESWSMGDLFKERQSFVLRILNRLPSTRNRSQILYCQFKNA